MVLAGLIAGALTSPAMGESFGAALSASTANAPVYGVIALCVSLVIVPAVSAFTKKLPRETVEAAFGAAE